MRILVLGGSGFIGQNIIFKSINSGHQITNISWPVEHEIIVGQSHLNYYYDLTTTLDDKIKEVLSRSYDVVIYSVGWGNHSKYFNGGKDNIDIHLCALFKVINHIKRDQLKKFIYFDSSNSYGSNIAPQNENMRELPFSPYSYAKTSATHFLQMLHVNENFPAIILRLFLPYGPKQKNMLIPYVINNCLNNNEFSVSAGRQIRDFLYIDDLIEAVFASISSKSCEGELINVGSGVPITVKYVVEYIVDYIGKGKPQFGELLMRDGENECLYADITKAKTILGWKPRVEINEGLERTVDYYTNRNY